MRKLICDCCGKELNTKSKKAKYYRVNSWSNSNYYPPKDFIEWDLCPSCYKKIECDMKLIMEDRKKSKS